MNLANRLQFTKLKPSKVVVTIYKPLAGLFIHKFFFCQTFEKSKFAKHSPHQTFPLYGIYLVYPIIELFQHAMCMPTQYAMIKMTHEI